VTRGQLPQRAGSLGLNGGGTAAAVPPAQHSEPCKKIGRMQVLYSFSLVEMEILDLQI